MDICIVLLLRASLNMARTVMPIDALTGATQRIGHDLMWAMYRMEQPFFIAKSQALLL